MVESKLQSNRFLNDPSYKEIYTDIFNSLYNEQYVNGNSKCAALRDIVTPKNEIILKQTM